MFSGPALLCQALSRPGSQPQLSYKPNKLCLTFTKKKKKKIISALRKKSWALFCCALASSGTVSLKKALFLPFLHKRNWEAPAVWKETSFSWFPEQSCRSAWITYRETVTLLHAGVKHISKLWGLSPAFGRLDYLWTSYYIIHFSAPQLPPSLYNDVKWKSAVMFVIT